MSSLKFLYRQEFGITNVCSCHTFSIAFLNLKTKVTIDKQRLSSISKYWLSQMKFSVNVWNGANVAFKAFGSIRLTYYEIKVACAADGVRLLAR